MNTYTLFQKRVPLGVHLCREPMPPMRELKRDMELLKQQGFNLIKLQEHWMIDEPREGEYDFSRYEELIDAAARLDMAVYLGFTCEQAPHWLYEKHPDCRMVRRDGVTVLYEAPTTLPADGKPGPCFDHPGALADMDRFLTEAVRVLGRFENLAVWNTWQEVAYWSHGLVGGETCFCEHTLAFFRRWLHERHGNIDALNRAWNTRYPDWSAITPSRGTAVQPEAVELAWRHFMDNAQIEAILRRRAEVIRAADPLKRPVFAHKGGPTFGAGQDWTYAHAQDFLGTSTYPAWNSLHGWDDGRASRMDRHDALTAELMDGIIYRLDHLRGANRPGAPLWFAEFQGGPVSTGIHKGRVPSADDLRRWMLGSMAGGCTAISFWVARAEIASAELNGFSLFDSLGDTTPRLEEAARIGRALNQHPELFGQPTLAPASVALLVSESNYQLCARMARGVEHLDYAVRGWHRALWNAGIGVDLLHLDGLDPAIMSRYRTLILPFPLCLAEADAERLEAFVEAGGNLVSDAFPGRVNEYGFCPRGEMSPTMQRLFGVRSRSVTMVREPGDGQRWSPQERTWGEYRDAALLAGAGPLSGETLRAQVNVQTFDCLASEPILWCDDAPAGVVRTVGTGQAWLLGTCAGHGATAYRDAASAHCLRTLFERCQAPSDRVGRLLRRRRTLPDREAWLFFNPTPETVEETCDLTAWARVTDLLDEPLTREHGQVRLSVRPLDWRVLLLER